MQQGRMRLPSTKLPMGNKAQPSVEQGQQQLAPIQQAVCAPQEGVP